MRGMSKYFHPRKFIENNINFRIATSAALSKFKNEQSFILTQVQQNPFHTFSKTGKEILLFKYDIVFDFLCELEQYLLVENGEIDNKYINYMIDSRVSYSKRIFDENEEVLDTNYINLWIINHQPIRSFYQKKIMEILNLKELSLGTRFSSVVDLSLKIMNHTLHELEEIDSMLCNNSDQIVLILDDICGILEDSKECTLLFRAKNFYKYKKFKSVILKNYLPEFNLSEIRGLIDFFKKNKIEYKII